MSLVKINDILKVEEGVFKVASSGSLPSDNAPTYNLYRTPSITDEGTTVTYTLNTNNVAEGTVVSYTVTGISQSDLSSGSLTGDFTVDDLGLASVSFTIANDQLTEGTETMLLSAGGQSLYVIINDTSLNPFNTVLLLNGNGVDGSSNRFITDESPLNLPIDRINTPTLSYDDLTNSPSVYFKGIVSYMQWETADYYKVSADYSSPFQFPSGTFTVEAWVKFDTVYGDSAGYSRVILTNANSSTAGWGIGAHNGKLVVWLSGDYVDINGTTTLSPNVWYHIAMTGSPNSYKLFLNGIQEGSTYNGTPRLVRFDGGALGIGAMAGRPVYEGANAFKGYIKGIRIISGTNLYTQNFSENLPATPFQAIDNTVLLINPSPNIVDSTSTNRLILTQGNTQITTTNFKYGTGSLYFDGDADFLQMPVNSNMVLGTDNFTIEFWCNFVDSNYTAGNYSRTIMSQGNTFRILVIGVTSSGNPAGSIAFWAGTTTTGRTVMTVNDGSWHHIAFTRDSGIMRCFVDGILKSTINNSTNFNNTTSPYYIGRQLNGGYYKGFLDDIRIVKGVALYTQEFTPPTQGLLT